VLRLCQILENRHRDIICTHLHCQPKLNSQWIGVCQHMQHGTVNLKDYLLQWNKPIRILSSWGDNVYGYDFKWRDVKKNVSQN